MTWKDMATAADTARRVVEYGDRGNGRGIQTDQGRIERDTEDPKRYWFVSDTRERREVTNPEWFDWEGAAG